MFLSVYGQKRPPHELCATGGNRTSIGSIVRAGSLVYPLRSSAVRLLLDSLQVGSQNRTTRRRSVSEVASLALERFNVNDKILHAHAAQVLIGLNLMKDRAPDWHLVGAVRGWSLRTVE